MKNSDLSQKIKSLRTAKGMSQEQLAGRAELSLRTIQRIENGDTEPRGDTLVRLANALAISHTELIGLSEREDKTYLSVLNLSALSFMLFPLLGILVPLLLWINKKNVIKDLDAAGKNLINFQITWCLLLGFNYLYMFGSFLLNVHGEFALEAFFGLKVFVYVLYAINFIYIMMNALRSAKARRVIYQPAIPFLN